MSIPKITAIADVARLERVVQELSDMGNADIPCRVSAETRAHLEQQAQNDQFVRKFDAMDEAMMQDLFGKTMAVPLASFLIAWEQVENTESSFGADRDKVFDFLRPHLAALKDACVKTFEEDQ